MGVTFGKVVMMCTMMAEDGEKKTGPGGLRILVIEADASEDGDLPLLPNILHQESEMRFPRTPGWQEGEQ